jgi:hypothetical protein
MGISWEYWNRTGVSPSGCRTQLALNLELEVRYELNHDVLAMNASRLVGPPPSFLRGHGLIRS